MMIQEKRPQLNSNHERNQREAACLYALITARRSVSRRNRASWYLRQLNKEVSCDSLEEIENDCQDLKSENVDDCDESDKDQDQRFGKGSSSVSIEEQLEQQQHGNHHNPDEKDIFLVSISSPYCDEIGPPTPQTAPMAETGMSFDQRFFVTPNTHVLYLSKSIATSIILDLSPSIVSVSPQNDCVFLDSMFDALKRVLHLLVKTQEVPSSVQGRQQFLLAPKVFVSVIAYTPFIVAKNNQVLVQNRRISVTNIDQVLVEIWLCLNRLTQEIHDLVSSTCGFDLGYDSATKTTGGTAFVFPQPIGGSIIRHPGSVLEDIYELGLFSSHLMPRLSRLSIITISDGLFASSNNLSIFRLKSIAVSFVSLGMDVVHPDGCFGYTPHTDLMRFVSKTTQGVYITHRELINSSQYLSRAKGISLMDNPLYRLFCWTLHSSFDSGAGQMCYTPKPGDFSSSSTFDELPETNTIDMRPQQIARFFFVDQPIDAFDRTIRPTNSQQAGCYGDQPESAQNYHDWRSFKQLDRNLDADFEQVLSCLLREGYLIKSIQFKPRETSRIIARLVLHWKHNLDLEQELTAPYWNTTDPFELNDSNNLILRPFNAPIYGDTNCEIFVHGSYSFLHNLYCDKKVKRRTDYKEISYRQFRQLIDGVVQTHDRLQYLSRFYRDPSLSKVPSYLLHGNSLLYEQPHTHKLTSTIDNVVDEAKTNEFQEYWQKISCLDTKSWKNLMHVHTVRLVLEHDQHKHKNLHCQNANGRYTHITCRRALSAISNFIKGYASFALLEDSTYIKFIYNKDDVLRDIGISSTKGFIVIQINKLLPIVVIYLMFTSGILDSQRVEIVNYLERRLIDCKLRSGRASTVTQTENILKSKTIYSISDSSCCTLIKSPLERMLRVYSRNFIGDYLTHNLAIGLAGSYPFIPHQQQPQSSGLKIKHQHHHQTNSGKVRSTFNNSSNTTSTTTNDHHNNHIDGEYSADNSINRYNLVFGKYLYGVRVVHTVRNFPHDLVHPIANNVLAKISAILVNIRIKQGFHIAFNNSGILNLVVEMAMSDHSHDFHTSTCLCQYIVFPPAITSSCPPPTTSLNVANVSATTTTSTSKSQTAAATTTKIPSQLQQASNNSGGLSTSKPNSSTGSTDLSYHMSSRQNTNSQVEATSNCGGTVQPPQTMIIRQNNLGEIKVIREYWIEQQYGISAHSNGYHNSLQNMRYSEVVDHLFLTDSNIFECLLTYELLQLLCDKLSPFYELDTILAARADTSTHHSMNPIFSPTSSIHSSISSTNSSTQQDPHSPIGPSLPSNLIEGSTRDGNSKVPLLEIDYEFSLVNFLDCCQQASLNVLLFRDKSNYYENIIADLEKQQERELEKNSNETLNKLPDNQPTINSNNGPKSNLSRKTSVDVNSLDRDHGRRDHRSSYDNLNTSSNIFVNPIYSPSLNHLFLDTLHKRLKQMHDKEHKLSEADQKRLASYMLKRKISFEERQQSSKRHVDDKNDGYETAIKHSEHAKKIKQLEAINWRCFLRKGNQENLMIVLIPASLGDVNRWMEFVERSMNEEANDCATRASMIQDFICPIFVFRCSSTMINDYVLSHLHDHKNADDLNAHTSRTTTTTTESSSAKPNCKRAHLSPFSSSLESDTALHFGQPCNYMNQIKTVNDELDNDIFPIINRLGANAAALNQPASDEKTLEIVHFRAFLRKLKNTVLKSRFSSLNDAYLSELFIHKDDLLYYINNLDADTQKQYHVSSQLKSLAEFIKSYDDYTDSLPEEPPKKCNQLLNSILLQKCGLFINQPIARFDETNPLMKQLNDRKLLFLMRCNYKIELPILEENLTNSTLLKSIIGINNHKQQLSTSPCGPSVGGYYNHSPSLRPMNLITQSHSSSHSINHDPIQQTTSGGSHRLPPITGLGVNQTVSSLGRSCEGSRLLEMKYGSMGSAAAAATSYPEPGGGTVIIGSPCAKFALPPPPAPSSASSDQQNYYNTNYHHHHHQQQHRISPRYSSSSCLTLNSLTSPANDGFILEAFRGSSCPMSEISESLLVELASSPGSSAFSLNTDDNREPSSVSASSHSLLPIDISLRHEAHMAEVLRRKSERKESHHYRRVLKSKTNYNQSHSAIDQALKRVDSLGRLEHFCLTPLLFSPNWRSKLAPVRDHTIEMHSNRSNSLDGSHHQDTTTSSNSEHKQQQQQTGASDGMGVNNSNQSSSFETKRQLQQQEADERWHQMVCNNYIKEYEQYIQTLGFNSVQIRYPSNASSGFSSAATGSSSKAGSSLRKSSRNNLDQSSFSSTNMSNQQQAASSTTTTVGATSSKIIFGSSVGQQQKPLSSLSASKRDSIATVSNALMNTTAYDTGYLIKFLNSGCLVFKVGFCKPYVYSILYSIEGERFNDSNLKMNMAAFLDELDNIKVTMHLHSFTYDYHLRSIYSYISGRQMTFSPGYHLISFVDDFRKYYQKAPNYARNHILSGEINIIDLQVSGQQLYNYIVTHNSAYNLEVLEMTSSVSNFVTTNLNSGTNSLIDQQQQSDSKNQMKHHEESFSKTSFSGSGGGGGSSNLKDIVQEVINNSSCRNHANDYVLIELKREKVRHRDGKDPDVFECGLLITHDAQDSTLDGKHCLMLKYFLLLTNQRDLYPKLVHRDDAIISFGCHKPIRLGAAQMATKFQQQQQQQQQRPPQPPATITTTTTNQSNNHNLYQPTTTPAAAVAIDDSAEIMARELTTSTTQSINNHPPAPSSIITIATATTATTAASTATTGQTSDQDDFQSSDLLSSGEISGPRSIISTVNSIQSQSSSTGNQSSLAQQQHRATNQFFTHTSGGGDTSSNEAARVEQLIATSQEITTADEAEEATDALSVPVIEKSSSSKGTSSQLGQANKPPPPPIVDKSTTTDGSQRAGSDSENSSSGSEPPLASLKRRDVSAANVASAPPPTTTRMASRPQRTASVSTQQREQLAICDEEITYLGYFSSDEMDMLKFLQKKTTNLKQHIEQIVHQAEIHYRRDYLWQKLMQRNEGANITSSSGGSTGGGGLSGISGASSLISGVTATATSGGGGGSAAAAAAAAANSANNRQLLAGYDQQSPLTVDELLQLLQIVEAIDLASLDPQLINLISVPPIGWHMKLLKAFNDLKQSSINQHRIYHVKVSKNLLLFIDPQCTTAFILIAIDQNRGQVEMSMLLKDKQECGKIVVGGGSGGSKSPINNNNNKHLDNLSSPPHSGGSGSGSGSNQAAASASIELEQDCQQLINDFVNFCATFMWSTFLS